MKLLYKKLPSGEMGLEEVNPYKEPVFLNSGLPILTANKDWIEFEANKKTYHTDSILEEGKEYDMDEFDLATQAKHIDKGWIDVDVSYEWYKSMPVRQTATLKAILVKPTISQETALEMLESLKVIQPGLMDLITYNIIPDENCPDVNDWIDLAHKAISKAEEELNTKDK